jgi:hypothetical protein
VDGKTRTKAETLHSLTALATGDEGDTEVKAHDYGLVERIAEIHHKTHFVRIALWVRRPAGWRAFIYLDTPIPAKEPHPTPPKEADKNCENPCKSLPYKPTTAVQQAVIDAWLKLKIDEWQAIPDDWKTHVSESMVVTSPSMFLDKAGRLALLTRQKEAYGTGSPSAPVVSMRLFEFGNAVIMIALHGPNAAGKPSYAVRIFVNEDGDWKIALSAQTDIKQPASASN